MRARRRWPGSSPPTPSCSARCSSSAAAPVIGSAASASSSAASSCSCSARSSAASHPTWRRWSALAHSRGSARRSWCPPRWPCSSAPTHPSGACRSSPNGVASAPGGRHRSLTRCSHRVDRRLAMGVLREHPRRPVRVALRTTSTDRVRRRFRVEAPDYLGVGLMSLALASLVLAITEGSTWGWTDGRILGVFAVALVAGAVFVAPNPPPRRPSDRPHPVPQPPVRHRQHRDHRVRHRVLRHAARQHPVPHRSLELLDHAGRSRRDARAASSSPSSPAQPASWRRASGSDRCSCPAQRAWRPAWPPT